MNCCDEYGDCRQGRDCPIRTGYGHRRVRAGQPVCDDTGCLPVQYTQEQIDEWRREVDREAVEFWLIVACLIGLFLVATWFLMAML